jgi:hypothetical protein
MEWEVLVDTTQASDEVVFERSDGAFGGIAAMDAGGSKLKVDVFVAEKLLQGLGAFVVKALQAWLEAGGT